MQHNKTPLNIKQRIRLQQVLARALRHSTLLPVLSATLVMAASVPAHAAVFDVTDQASLELAIRSANTFAGPHTINFNGNNIALTSDLPPITGTDITISGGTIDAGGNRGLVIGNGSSGAINVTLRDLAIENAAAVGGNGGNGSGGGGGGAGLGGAIFVNSNARVTLDSVTFSSNAAQGGNGGVGNGAAGGGGGGAMNGGDGGDALAIPAAAAGGGGGGLDEDGQDAQPDPSSNGAAGAGGASYGGAGGGSGGSTAPTAGGDGQSSGGGGGGSGFSVGGDGDFGAGGGGAGAGLFGSPSAPGAGGLHGGNGGAAGVDGGGGSGLGGAIYVRDGGSITVTGNTNVNGNAVSGGAGSTAGVAAGSGLAFSGDQFFQIGAGETTRIDDTIIGSGWGRIVKDGAGTLILGGDNTYAGVLLDEGTVRIEHNNALGTGNLTVGWGAGATDQTLDYGLDGMVVNTQLLLNSDLALNVDSGQTATQTGVISGYFGNPNAGITKTGDGTLILQGTHTYTDDTNVNGGTLRNDGSLAGSVNVNNSSTFINNLGAIVNGDLTANDDGGVELIGSTVTGDVTLNDTADLFAQGANIVQGSAALNGDNSLWVRGIASGTDIVQDNSLTVDGGIQINSGGSVFVSGLLTNVNVNVSNTSVLTNSLNADITGSNGMGGTVGIGAIIVTHNANNTNNANNTSSNIARSTLTGDVTLDGVTSHVTVGAFGIGDGLGGSVNYDSTNTIENTLDGNVTLTNGGVVDLFAAEVLVGNDVGSSSVNSITSTITGNVDVTNGDVNFNAGTFEISGVGSRVNNVTNTVRGSVILNGSGKLNFSGDSDLSDTNNVTNTILGAAILNGGADLSVSGANNSIVGGLILNTDTLAQDPPFTSGNEGNDVTRAIIGGNDSGNAVNELTTNVVIFGNPNGSTQRPDDLGYDADSGHLYIGAFGLNTAGTGENIVNRLDGDAGLIGLMSIDPLTGANNFNNSGGMIVLGASDHNLTGGATVTNEITGSVWLGGGSRLHLGGDKLLGDDNAANHVTNRVGGDVVLRENSFMAMWGENDARLQNVIDGKLTLLDNAYLRVEGVNNVVNGNTTLSGNAIAQLGGSGGTHTPVSNIASDFLLTGNSQLRLGNLSEFYNYTPVTNHIDGDLTLVGNSRLRVLSGGSGGENSSAGSSNISGDLVIVDDTTFEVSAGNGASAGLRVDGAGGATVVGATVQINGGSALAFGRRYSILEAANGITGTLFNNEIVLADANGNVVTTPNAFTLNLGYGLNGAVTNSVYFDLGTEFNSIARTTNQRNLARYLDRLVADSTGAGVDPDSDLGRLLNVLAWRNANGYNNALGDTFAAYDAAGYWRAARFTNRLAQRALQSGNEDWVQPFAMNAGQGLAGIGSQMSLTRQLLNARPAVGLAANGGGYGGSGLWGDVSGDWVRNEGDSSLGSPDWRLNSKAVALGYQSGSESFRWGVAGGFHEGDLSFGNRSASGDTDGWNLGLHGLWQRDAWYVNGVLGYGRDSNELRREDGVGINRSDFRSRSLSALLETGKRLEISENTTATPYISLLGVKYDRDEVSESGSGSGLNVDDASRTFLTSSVGVRFGREFLNDAGRKRGGVMLGLSWLHQFSDTEFPVRSSLQGAPGGGSFTTYGTPLSKNSLGLQVGGYARLSETIVGFLNYNGAYSSNQKAHSVAAGVEYQF